MKYIHLILCVSIACSYKLPDGIKLCHRSQKDFAECVGKNMRGGLGAFAPGYKEMGIPTLNPYFIEKLEIKPPSPDSSVAIHLTFTNLHVSGMTVTDIDHMEIDFDKGCSWVMDAVSPFIILDGEYTMDGKLLLFALNAHGKANVTQVNLRNRHSMWCEKYQKKGKTHIRFINYTMDMRPDNVLFEFTNLFPSNKDIENEIGKTLNENSLAIFNEIKAPVEQIFSTIHTQIANQVLSKIPFDDIFLP
ncbi:unnamed protein product [Psylliodes chrysocephalus]|uniref:Uncharacterized protein n=1 Tax=Psylliodes chrysocephalus TaxID=3402493 RepID=A0A9P0D2P6_9CUCU|nr:unnamed protein product [Psylliodes chrysocephala]